MTAGPPEELRVGAGAVVVRDGRLLLVRTTYGWAAGKWVIPNGLQRPGESLADCALRELHEETGLSGTAGALLAVRSLSGPGGSDTFVALAVEALGEPVPDSREVDAAAFFDLPTIERLAAEGLVVPVHHLIAKHALSRGSAPAIHTLPALDHTGRPGASTVYLV